MSMSRIFTVTTEHAVRAMVRLSKLAPGESILGRELAVRTSIPGNYLSKVLVTLRNAGLVQTSRGQGGGYRLAKPAAEIKLAEIVELFEGAVDGIGCVLGEDHACCDELGCAAHQRWKRVVEAYVEFLSASTLAEVAEETEAT